MISGQLVHKTGFVQTGIVGTVDRQLSVTAAASNAGVTMTKIGWRRQLKIDVSKANKWETPFVDDLVSTKITNFGLFSVK